MRREKTDTGVDSRGNSGGGDGSRSSSASGGRGRANGEGATGGIDSINIATCE